MKVKGVLRGLLVLAAVLGFCLPQPLLVAETVVTQTPLITDVVLMDGGVLMGQVVNPQGIGLAKVSVSLRNHDKEVARVVTDRNGYFAVRGLRGGVYQLVGANSHRAFRLWAGNDAPPLSQRGALLVAGGDTVRGAAPGSLPMLLASPLVVGGILAVAVITPVVVHNAERPSSP